MYLNCRATQVAQLIQTGVRGFKYVGKIYPHIRTNRGDIVHAQCLQTTCWAASALPWEMSELI